MGGQAEAELEAYRIRKEAALQRLREACSVNSCSVDDGGGVGHGDGGEGDGSGEISRSAGPVFV